MKNKHLLYIPIMLCGLFGLIFFFSSFEESREAKNNNSDTFNEEISTVANATTIIGTYTTNYSNSTNERKTNIKLASEKLNGVVIMPSEKFSFNETVGPNTKELGYRESKIFIDGEESIGYGGGVCQVSSTLYNAVYSLGFDILERHAHSKEVYYVPKDRDAATSYGGIDFQFTNNSDRVITIQSTADGENLKVDILG